MALRFADSFDHYTSTTDRLTKWTTDLNATGNIGTGIGRFGTNGWPSAANTRQMLKTLDARASWIVGVAFTADATLTFNTPLVCLLDSTTLQVYVRINSAGKLEVVRHSGTVLGTGSSVLSPNVYHYLELKATIDNSSGVAVVRLDENIEINLSGVDTQNTGNATADGIALNGGAIGSGVEVHYDDLYVCDTSGSSPTNDFLGDVRVEALFPNGNGNSSQLVGSDGNSTDNYLLVDETAPNGDTDYVESSTVGDKDTYAYSNMTPTSGTVYGVQPLLYAKKTDAGTRKIASIARVSGTEVDSSDDTLLTSYSYFPDIRETKPGGGAWSVSDVNGAEFGVKVTA